MLKSRTEKSVGIVLLNPQKEVLVAFKKSTNVWEFPQGKIEEGEDLIKALKREVREETGIENFRLVKDFQKTTYYSFKREGYLVNKTVVYFLGITEEDVSLSEEHEQYHWCNFKEANKLFKHDNHKEVLKSAFERLKKPLNFIN